ncbi:DUF429 domain-containing protein [Thiomicrorhabdus indica]|uniref:DUF429 domain-containing protein n=1 Tax=Thiomicrorhabdus indica TaxID=2267253 RepID=UPI002AA706F3|nr:DUF429 domain-containing protein [Thiomicrorhabdus indica]
MQKLISASMSDTSKMDDDGNSLQSSNLSYESNSQSCIFIGIDLSGPSNTSDTALCCYDGHQVSVISDLNDAQIVEFLQKIDAKTKVLLAIDAPLSYNEGGGYRDIDTALRQKLNQKGFSQLGVMPPTLTKMVYLTMRGMRLRELCVQFSNIQIFETHPGGSLALDGINYESIKRIKKDPLAVKQIWQQLTGRYIFLEMLKCDEIPKNDHEMMSIAAMLSVYRKHNHDQFFEQSSSILGQPSLIL